MRYGAHRGGRQLLAAVMPSVLAVAAVAALITSLAVWQDERADQPRAAASTTGRSASSSAAAPAISSAPAPATSSAAEPTEAEPTEAEPTAAEPARGSDMQVVVLNQTSRRGLASTVAEQLRSAGWPVPAVGNFRGIVPSTTVYYPPGGEAGALAVAADLPVEPRVRPSFGNLSETRLTVVVTDSYPS
ncbi:MAG: LytR C-terminal domain-containing protein [Spirochaetaceae bacterium]|nr:LytR C-terminal domain-containing protein [Spirochaetaceae bacterium]